jgi:hypothetical protein
MPSTLGGDLVNGPPASWFKLPPSMATVTHSRFFQDDNEYVQGTAPGLPADHTNWSWYIDKQGGTAVSGDARFFEHIFSRAKEGLRMATYEQDFLTKQYESNAYLQSEPGAAKTWLAAMASAANSTNVTLQYCMALPRHILQTASFPRVTQARASHDYGQSRSDDTEQWSSIGLTSLFYWSIGLLPFKDDFWSETDEPGNHWGGTEVDPELQTLVSSLIAGPVGPADAIGKLNRTRVMQACRADGTLLKPHAPAMNLDSTFSRAMSPQYQGSFVGVESVWGATMSAAATCGGGGTTPGCVPPPVHHLLLFANISSLGYTVHLSELQEIEAARWAEADMLHRHDAATAAAAAAAGQYSQKASSTSFVAREYYSGELRIVNATTPLSVTHKPRPASCASMDPETILFSLYCIAFELWTLAPIPSRYWLESRHSWVGGGFVLLGESDKYVGVSGQRFSQLKTFPNNLSVRAPVPNPHHHHHHHHHHHPALPVLLWRAVGLRSLLPICRCRYLRCNPFSDPCELTAACLSKRVRAWLAGCLALCRLSQVHVAGSASELVSVDLLDCMGGQCQSGLPDRAAHPTAYRSVACTLPATGAPAVLTCTEDGCTCE